MNVFVVGDVLNDDVVLVVETAADLVEDTMKDKAVLEELDVIVPQRLTVIEAAMGWLRRTGVVVGVSIGGCVTCGRVGVIPWVGERRVRADDVMYQLLDQFTEAPE